ncbi:MAG: family hydrolase [Glaciihabitans sp.]|nr:family hydrolase [Glaciihabitans sp.]
MTHNYTAVLFDLDGTIVDSAPGITATLAWTFEQLQLPIPTPADLLAYVGPPILDSFRDISHLSPEVAAGALAIYRERYLRFGVQDAAAFPGLREVLVAVREAGIPISLATSKPERPAKAILAELGFLDLFDVITGASEDEVRSAKKDVVAEALVRLAARGVDISRPVLVGDRKHDVEGAAANGVPTIFVEWGYGAPAEQAGAVAIARTTDELVELLVG